MPVTYFSYSTPNVPTLHSVITIWLSFFSSTGELEYQDPLQTLPNDVQELLKQHSDQQITLDGDKIIINGHIVKPDLPAIVDVLNRREQDHLFGLDGNGPMAIKILPGTPMDMPKQVRVPGKPLDPNEVTMIGNLEEEIPPPPKVNTSVTLGIFAAIINVC